MPPAARDDPHRPAYHFTTDNWMNDPIPFYADGAYHVYFQHNPGAAVWGDMHWGHAVSRDLVRWERRPVALAPTPGGPDHDGVWTGCVTRDGAGRYAALYTGIPRLDPLRQVQCLATSDDLGAWAKAPGEPIIADKPEGFGACFRDPQTFETGDGNRYMVIGGEQTDGRGGAAFLYRALSGDLTRWEYLHPLFLGGPETGHDFECPDFFPVGGGRWLLITSRGKTWWHLGPLADGPRFEREAFGPCDSGPFYAAKTLTDGQDRRLLFGWIQETRPKEAQVEAGWSGVLSLPRAVTLAGERPNFAFAPELEALRQEEAWRGETPLPARCETTVATLPDVAEITLRVGPLTEDTELLLACGADAAPATIPLPANAADTSVHVYLDRSVVEAIVNGRDGHTRRVYPEKPGTVRVAIRNNGGASHVGGIAWALG